MTTDLAHVRVALRGDSSPTAALNRISVVLSNQRVPLHALTMHHEPAEDRWILVAALGPLEGHAMEQLVKRLQREILVLDAQVGLSP
jgi:hypothetical protein